MLCHGFDSDFKICAPEMFAISSLVTRFENVIWDWFVLSSKVLAYD